MVEKRKRYVAVRESTQAKRRSTSPAGATATPEVPVRSLTPDVPTSFARDGPLPVLPKRQLDGLILKDYKTVAESKVMAESLIRSQRKWVDGDIFEKFWTKPLKSRKLDPVELEKNPSRDCMTKLGNCTLSCKPHKFEIRLFGVLEPVKVSPAPPVQQPVQKPPLQPQSHPVAPAAPIAMTPKPQYMSNPQHPPHPNTVAQPAHQPTVSYAPPQQTVPTPVPPPAQAPAMVSQVPGPPKQMPAPNFNSSTPSVPAPNFVVAVPPPNHPQQTYHQQPGNQNMVQQMPPPRPDPVIQSLAVRAASDPELKALMRIVASGKATTEQLKIFQGHIDALTPPSSQPMVPTAGRPRPLAPAQGPGAPAQARPQAVPQQMHPQQMHTQHQQHPQHLQHQHQHLHQHQHPQNLQHPQHPHPQYVQHPQYSQQQPHLLSHRPQYSQPHPAVQAPPKPKPFPQPPKQEITSVVFEFVDSYSQGDRFIFPKYTILEYVRNGTMVKASFMVTRKPIDDLDEYYQPMTVILESASPRTLEILQKVVADQETTCKYMKHLMETRKRAEDSFLVFRLRRDPNEVVPDKPEAHERIEPSSQKATREPRVRRDTSTPVRDSKSSADHTPQPALPSRPRVKTVKKALPKEPSQTVTPNASNDHSTSIPPTTPVPRTPKQPKPPRSRKGRIADPTKSCSLCNTSKTSLWRKADIHGENVTVCNACGIKWKTSTQRAAQVAAAQATGQSLPGTGSRENSSSGGARPTEQQLAGGGPQMPFHPFPPGQAGFAPPQNGSGQPVYPTTAGIAQGGQAYQQSFSGYQGQHESTVPSTQQQMQAVPSQQTNNTHQNPAAVSVPQPPAVDEQNETQLSATSSIVASHVAAHQPKALAAVTPTSEGLNEGVAPVG